MATIQFAASYADGRKAINWQFGHGMYSRSIPSREPKTLKEFPVGDAAASEGVVSVAFCPRSAMTDKRPIVQRDRHCRDLPCGVQGFFTITLEDRWSESDIEHLANQLLQQGLMLLHW